MTISYINTLLKKPLGSRRLNSAGKRIVDVVLAFLGLLFIFPFLFFIAWRIKADSPGPVFYWGKRAGRNGKTFRILKFRTMFEDVDSYNGPSVTGKGDARITPFGQWLRDSKVNELPQLWNVLIGEMSLVGPRPEDPEIVKTWPAEARKEILSMRPGITSQASVVFRNEEDILDSDNVMDEYLRTILPSKLRLDQLYVRNFSLLGDLDVIFWTFMALVPQARRTYIPEGKLFWGPFSFFFSRLFNWFLIDFLISFFSVAFVAGIWRTITPLDIGWGWGFVSSIGMSVIFSFYNLLFKNHLVYWRKANPREAIDIFIASVLAVGTIWLVDKYIVLLIDIPDGVYIIAGVLASLGFVGARFRERILTGLAWRWFTFRKSHAAIGERILVVGAGDLGSFATWLVRKSDLGRAFTVVGLVDDDPRKQNLNYDGMRILGSSQDIPKIVKTHDPGLILFAISNIRAADRQRILNICKDTGVRVVLVPNVMEMMHTYFKQASLSNGADVFVRPQIDIDQVSTWMKELDSLITVEENEAAKARLAEIQADLRERLN